jgi:replicative DNA helicase
MALYSLQVEKHALGGLIQNPSVISDIETVVGERDFVAEPHNVIFSCIRSAYLNNEKLDKVLLAQKIKNLGISFKDKIDIFDYIESISFSPITIPATIKACQELAKLRAFRDIEMTCDRMKDIVNKSVHLDLETVVSTVDAVYGDQINAFAIEDEPDDLFSGIYEMVEERGNAPVNEVGFATPYAEFNRLYGGLRNGNVYAIASRPGQGKTTWLNHLGCEMARIHGIPVLILDTEMTKEEIQFRNAAGFSGVPLWYLETGNWRKNPEMVEKVRNVLQGLKNTYKVYHYHVGNKNIDQIMSIMRRWYLKVVGRGKPALIIYDYLKITTEKVTQNWAEYQALGEKVDKLKRISLELNVPIFTAIQMNRSGENTGRQSGNVTDDATAIAVSDRLAWFGTYLAIFRRKTADEIALDTPESGTHKLIELKARYQGRDAAGHHDMILRNFPDGTRKYVRNYLNFSVENFAVTEQGSLRDSITRQNAQFLVRDGDAVQQRVEVQEETL